MISRRNFIATSAGATAGLLGLSALSYSRILGANDRLGVAVMGIRSRGKVLAECFIETGQDLAWLCDVDRDILSGVADELGGRPGVQPRRANDFRQALEDPAVDALVIATPDHWHAPATILGLQAGKHVYVEKPCSHNPREGEWLVAAQRRHGLVVQMGNQQRSSPETIEFIAAIRAGAIGEVYAAQTWYSNHRGSIGQGQEVAPPAALDWDLWQGPAPRRPYRDNVHPYNWHWFWHWGTGETCNNAAHELDIARWAMGLGNAARVTARGERRYFRDDDWEMYDTLALRLDYPGGRSISWEGHSCNDIRLHGRGRGTLLIGSGGSAIVDREGYEIRDLDGRVQHQVSIHNPAAATSDLAARDFMTEQHIRNFIGAVRGTATQHSPIDEGATSTLMCHLGNIAYRSGSELECDPDTGRIISGADPALWGRDYEAGWAPQA